VAIKNSKSRVTGNIGHKTQNEDKENKKLKIDQLKRCETRTSPKNCDESMEIDNEGKLKTKLYDKRKKRELLSI
jgi:hypothetical protein